MFALHQPRSPSDTAKPEPAELRHFLDLDRLDAAVLRAILEDAIAAKAAWKAGLHSRPLAGRTLAMIFEKPSTRTRVSFEVGIRQLGGEAVVLSAADMQLGRGESVADTARVLSRYVDAIVLRTSQAAKLLELADHATVPVLNGLTDRSHPVQVMADVMTFEEHRGVIAGRKVAWLGDVNNVLESWVHAAGRFGFRLAVACPAASPVPERLLGWARRNGADVTVTQDPLAAAEGAALVTTDTWTSMNHVGGAAERHRALEPFQVNSTVMAHAAADALFMHCLPAHRGEEVTPEVIDGPQSAVWDEAENRLHIQKAILLWCLGKEGAWRHA